MNGTGRHGWSRRLRSTPPPWPGARSTSFDRSPILTQPLPMPARPRPGPGTREPEPSVPLEVAVDGATGGTGCGGVGERGSGFVAHVCEGMPPHLAQTEHQSHVLRGTVPRPARHGVVTLRREHLAVLLGTGRRLRARWVGTSQARGPHKVAGGAGTTTPVTVPRSWTGPAEARTASAAHSVGRHHRMTMPVWS